MTEATPLDKAEDYGEFKVYPEGHDAAWERLQRGAVVPPDIEYDEVPRGRVVYNTASSRFRLLADACILNDRSALAKIMAELDLRDNIEVASDEHYRCSYCLRKSSTKQSRRRWQRRR